MHRVNLSKLEISIYQELKPMEEDTFKEDASDAVKGGTDGIKTVIVGALYIWPFWIISLIAIVWLMSTPAAIKLFTTDHSCSNMAARSGPVPDFVSTMVHICRW